MKVPTQPSKPTRDPYCEAAYWKPRRRHYLPASNGPVEAINARLEHLRGIALGFKNLNHYILRCLIHPGQLKDKINALQNRKSF